MSENPTIPQILQRLAVVAQDMVKIEPDSEIVYVYRREAWRKATKIGQLDPDLLFGAACEKIESLGWDFVIHYMCDNDDGYAFYRIDIDCDTYQVRRESESLTRVMLKALLAALEGRLNNCPNCEGSGKVIEKTGKVHGRKFQINGLCPECQGSGKKQEVGA